MKHRVFFLPFTFIIMFRQVALRACPTWLENKLTSIYFKGTFYILHNIVYYIHTHTHIHTHTCPFAMSLLSFRANTCNSISTESLLLSMICLTSFLSFYLFLPFLSFYLSNNHLILTIDKAR